MLPDLDRLSRIDPDETWKHVEQAHKVRRRSGHSHQDIESVVLPRVAAWPIRLSILGRKYKGMWTHYLAPK